MGVHSWKNCLHCQYLQSIIITDNNILKQRCQVGCPDWHKIKGINVVIDSERVDTGEQHAPAPAEAVNAVIDSENLDTSEQHEPAPAEAVIVVTDMGEHHRPAPAEAVVHPSNYMQIEGSPIVNDTDSRGHLAEHRPHSLSGMDTSEGLHQPESNGQLPPEMDATEYYMQPMQVSEQHLVASLRMNIDQEKDTLQIENEHYAVKRRRQSKA